MFISSYLLRLTSLETGIALSFGIFVNLWIHTNLWVDIGPLEFLFVTPNYHRIHHGGRGLVNRNMGFVPTVWIGRSVRIWTPWIWERVFLLSRFPWRNGFSG